MKSVANELVLPFIITNIIHFINKNKKQKTINCCQICIKFSRTKARLLKRVLKDLDISSKHFLQRVIKKLIISNDEDWTKRLIAFSA